MNRWTPTRPTHPDPLGSGAAVDPSVPRTVRKVQLVGTVAGIEACRVLTEADEIIVGSALGCDLVVLDPLAPKRAFRIFIHKDHREHAEDCTGCWLVEAYAGTRLYVNGSLARIEPIRYGDVVSLGCHRFEFEASTHGARDSRSNVQVNDVLGSLLGEGDPPRGFLQGLPSWRDRLRTRKAAWFGAVLAALLALCFVLFREEPEDFESIQPPVEVTMLSDQMVLPKGDATTSLKTVQRKSFDAPEDVPKPADLQTPDAQPLPDMASQPLIQNVTAPNEPPPPPQLTRVVDDAGPVQGPPSLEVAEDRVKLSRDTAKLGKTAPTRRLTVTEAEQERAQVEMGTLQARVDKGAMASATSTKYASEFSRAPREKPVVKFDSARAEVLGALQPSPVKLEMVNGNRVPVARLPEQLTAMQVAAGADQTPGIVMDGNVSEGEIAKSFKTGRFRIHGPGTPPEADPPTYCYVSKTTVDGKDYLYVSYVCVDPNLSALVVNFASGTSQLCWDDSVEFFIDIDGNRTDYHQIIVNAKGEAFSQYCPNAEIGINGQGSNWDSGLQVKSTINRDAGRWVCEMLIPFSKFPNVPAKGTKVPVNFCRNFRGQKNANPASLQNWFSVWEGANANYHHPRLFGLLEWP